VRWLRENLFGSWGSTLATLGILWLAWMLLPPFVEWAFLKAVWFAPDSRPCRAEGAGACWALIAEKHRFILFGTYPYEQHWRPGAAILVLFALYTASALRRFWRPALALAWLGGLALIGLLT